MKTLLILLCALSFGYSQTDRDEVIRVLYDYMDGTSNGEIDRLKNAFEKNSALYTVGQDGELVRRPSDKYIKVFTPGKRNNRKGQIIHLDIVNNAATAVLEIALSQRVFTDYILLLKLNDGWKIINKSYTFEYKPYKGKILFVVSNKSTYGDTQKRTGSHYGELVSMYDTFLSNGYEVDFVSPNGGAIPVSYINLNNPLQYQYFYDSKLNYKLKTSSTPSDIDIRSYKSIVYVGGSATMFDIPNNQSIMDLTRTMIENENGIVGAVCHGVGGLVNLKLSNGRYFVDGKVVNSFTNSEESQSGNDKYLPFLIESKLKEHGATFRSSANWEKHVEVSQGLVTGQNPASSKAVAEEIIKLLDK
jgi:putative intracellular protease/amidase